MKCPKCSVEGLRGITKITIELDADNVSKINKKLIRDVDTKLKSLNDVTILYCPNCKWNNAAIYED